MSIVVGKLPAGKALIPGVTLFTASGKTSAALSANGDFVLKVNQVQRWSAGTANQAIASVGMELDGNLQIRDTAKRIVWQSGTGGHAGAYLEITDTAPWLAIRDAQGVLLWTYYGLPSNGTLRPGQVLLVGQAITSPSGKVKLVMGSTGLSLRSDPLGEVWSTTAGRYAMMCSDGNFIVCDDAGSVLWQTETAGNENSSLIVGDLIPSNWLSIQKSGTGVWTWCPVLTGNSIRAGTYLQYGQEVLSPRGTTKLAVTERGLSLSAQGPAGWTTSWEILTTSPCRGVRFEAAPSLGFSDAALTVRDLLAKTSYRLVSTSDVANEVELTSGSGSSSVKSLINYRGPDPVVQFVVTDGRVILLASGGGSVGTIGTPFIL
ncbi:MAG TPA: hypothetical protein PLA94_21990 [Myxococcota bacterium]|nr:hypothetical protein [Myxococcota bacterium]